jgi:hypothetical protein
LQPGGREFDPRQLHQENNRKTGLGALNGPGPVRV